MQRLTGGCGAIPSIDRFRQCGRRARDLLFALGNLPFSFGYLTAEFFILSQQPIILPAQLFTAGLV